MFLFLILFILLNSINSCPLTDNYLSRCHCEILTNGESYIKCHEKTLNEVPIFKRSFPYDRLILANNNIKNLTRSAFDTIKTIRRINLENNSISFIDNDLLRLLGNYLEELVITGDNIINSLEFLTRYPLKNLRILKLHRFNLSEVNLENVFLNMTKLEILSLPSCQLKQIPNLKNIHQLDLENNQISNTVHLSRSYVHLNLAKNFISSIILENNTQLISLNLTENILSQFSMDSIENENLQDINLSQNYLSSFNFSILNDQLLNLNLNSNHLLSLNLIVIPTNLLSLSISNNLIKQIKFSNRYSSLVNLDLSSNQLKSIEKHFLFEKLNYLNLENNPLDCNCQLEWLKTFILHQTKLNATTWTCRSNVSPISFLSADFQCASVSIPRVQTFNISYVKISIQYGLYIQWSIIDDKNILDYLQISISEPFYLSPKISPNQTEIFLSNQIKLNQQYHLCLILLHKYARDKYCRVFQTDKLIILTSNEIILERNEQNAIQTKDHIDINLFIMLIGSCIGGFITFILILTCFYLCIQIHKYKLKKNKDKTISYYTKNSNLHYPIYHTHSITCPYHHENLSNSTDTSQIDTSLSTTNLKHIYQTIDNHDYSSLTGESQVFDLWNQSLKHKR
ncbi:unnamed protein product [Rotaria socialis]|uniref:Uncharacterized protein n=1 Tax=Rotaria socialis TaxID=392032 RepID=A0A817Z623_9BILA|nr:unnamed protein product [Rotaria socialis]CAF4481029.1 unnamed protein product [Rotaria socialis]